MAAIGRLRMPSAVFGDLFGRFWPALVCIWTGLAAVDRVFGRVWLAFWTDLADLGRLWRCVWTTLAMCFVGFLDEFGRLRRLWPVWAASAMCFDGIGSVFGWVWPP